jgi:hypothetical protein
MMSSFSDITWNSGIGIGIQDGKIKIYYNLGGIVATESKTSAGAYTAGWNLITVQMNNPVLVQTWPGFGTTMFSETITF